MKKLPLLLVAMCCLGIRSEALALEVNKEFGKPTNEEMTMTVYENDPDADAVVLYSNTSTRFQQDGENIAILYAVKERIKILKPEGVKQGDVTVVYYDPEKSISKERVSNIKAFAYNIENGKVVRTKMTNDLKTTERINEKFSQVKFSIPNVKVGTVIEYEYRRYSDYYSTIDDWIAQREDMPVAFTEYSVEIPSCFGFNIELSGMVKLQQSVDLSNFTYATSKGSVTFRSGINKFFGQNLPRVPEDDWVYCEEDFVTKVVHDLNWIEFPGSSRKSYTANWEKVDSVLMSNDDFGKYYKMHNPLEAEQAAMGLPDSLSVMERTRRLRELLMKNFGWNNNYGIYGISERKLQKELTANSATLNFALMSMLRDANITAYPVVMSRRSRGRLPYTHASGESLNTMVLQVLKEDNKPFYVDATCSGFPMGTLPSDLLAERARVIRDFNSAEWVNLSHICTSRSVSTVRAKLSADGTLAGKQTLVHHGISSAEFRHRYHAAKDSTAFVQGMATSSNVEITEYNATGIPGDGDEIKEELSFTRTVDTDGEHIYLNPFLFVNMTSPFKAEERLLPVEYPYPSQERQTIQISLPEGYEVEELPQSLQVSLPDDDIVCRVKISLSVDQLLISINYRRKATFLPKDYYPALRDFWAKLEAKCNEMIVLKKADGSV